MVLYGIVNMFDQYQYKTSLSKEMAGAAGFEPTDAEIKTRCLTTWRRP